MNYYALAIGILIAVYVIVRFRKKELEKKSWAYAVFLATFPVYYWMFAAYATDYTALVYELTIGMVFISMAYLAYKLNSFIGGLILASGYIAHAIYDVIHRSLFHNAGTPGWWPEFCGAVDIIVGVYLLFLAFSMKLNHKKMSGDSF